MSRVLRFQKPGGVFHITTVTQGRAPWFVDELCPHIMRIVTDGVASAGAFLIAHAVMRNHLHIVAAQGVRTWGWTMKPILQRIALAVQRKHGVAGHVFERRYFSTECLDADHVRTAIHYTHRNPVKAGICGFAGDYVWSSYNELLELARSPRKAVLRDVLRFFSSDPRIVEPDDEQLLHDYTAHMQWWYARKQAEEGDQPFFAHEPCVAGGDEYFRKRFATSSAQLAAPPSEDLRDRALKILRRIAPDVDLETLRMPYVSRQAGEIRKQIMGALLSANYRGCDISYFFRVSPSVVSRISSAARWRDAS